MKVALLTPEQKELLVGKQYSDSIYFNPTEDINGNWIISIEEQEQCSADEYQWVKDLPLIDFDKKPIPHPNDL
jgi:hypothetical protein